jgi:hypothetical protein
VLECIFMEGAPVEGVFSEYFAISGILHFHPFAF